MTLVVPVAIGPTAISFRIRGGDLGDWGTVPPKKCEVGGRPMQSSSPIFWEVVLWDACESTKRVLKGVFLVGKGSYTTFNIVQIREIWEKKKENRKTWSMTKKGHKKFLTSYLILGHAIWRHQRAAWQNISRERGHFDIIWPLLFDARDNESTQKKNRLMRSGRTEEAIISRRRKYRIISPVSK